MHAVNPLVTSASIFNKFLLNFFLDALEHVLVSSHIATTPMHQIYYNADI